MKKTTKAQLVRDQIRVTRMGYGTDTEMRKSVVKWAVDTLGMKPTLAGVYVKGNWDK